MQKPTVIHDPYDVRSYPERLDLARNRFFASGETVKSWAERRGYRHQTVYAVLGGKHRCARGVLHKIAVDLGLKDGVHAANDADAGTRAQFLKQAGE